MSACYNNPIGAKLHSIIYDCDKLEDLAIFYAKLLGGKVVANPYGGYGVSVPGLGVELGFQDDETYSRPVWLGFKQDQQPMSHIDISVDDR